MLPRGTLHPYSDGPNRHKSRLPVDEIGSIRAGKLADFVVLEEDPYEVDTMRIKDIEIWGTVFEGEVHPVRTSQGPGDDSDSAVGLPNPAAVYCEEQGGEYRLEGGECRLADGTIVDAWEYYRANVDSGN